MNRTTATLILADEVFRIQGAVFQVYRAMGAGFLEGVYRSASRSNLKFAAFHSPLDDCWD